VNCFYNHCLKMSWNAGRETDVTTNGNGFLNVVNIFVNMNFNDQLKLQAQGR
jgi:hypothetical protein